MRKSAMLSFVLLTVLHATTALAQTRATAADLTGVIRDQTGAVLPGATIVATNTETNVARETTSQADGRFTLPALPPGTYRVQVTMPGFVSETRQALTLALGSLVDLDSSLKVAGTAEAITVSAEAPLVDSQRTAVSSVVSQQQIDSLPIDGRNFISFAVITPGVTTDRTPQQAGMKIRKAPVRPTWKPLCARHTTRIESWSKFISDVYWNAELEK